MNNYLDLPAIENVQLSIQLTIEPIVDNGVPEVLLSINKKTHHRGPVTDLLVINTEAPLLDPVCIQLSMSNKIYNPNQETAVIIKNIKIDGFELTEYHNDCVPYIEYQNDQNVDYRGFYLGFNGVWCFELDRPFYQWWHVVSGQGWLLTPAPVKSI